MFDTDKFFGNGPEAEFEKLTIELLKHRYLYYHLDNPSISDYDYDMMERKWHTLGDDLGVDWATYPNWVGWDDKHPLASKALDEMSGVCSMGRGCCEGCK